MLKRILLTVVMAVIAVVALSMGGFYWAISSSQPLYVTALASQQPRPVLEQKSRELESRFTTLHSDLQAEGEWRTLLAADEINGWLATKLPESYPDLLPTDIQSPRVAISPDGLFAAAQAEVAGVETVVSVVCMPFVTDQGDLAIELVRVRAGALPLPSQDVVDRLSRATERLELPIRWTQIDGRQVLVVERRLWDAGQKQLRTLEAIELTDGELYLSGKTESLPPVADEEVPADDTPASGESNPDDVQLPKPLRTGAGAG